MNPIDLERIRTLSLSDRASKVALEGFARPGRPGRSMHDFLADLPAILAGQDFRRVVAAIAAARRNNRPVLVGMGAHVIKCGLSPVLIDLMERRIITALALNGAAAIHDVEIALAGSTSEDVAAGLADGTFGMVRETAELVNRSTSQVLERPDCGMGQLLAEGLQQAQAPHQAYSLLAAGRRLGILVTVHVALGTDIVHMHPSANGAAIGQASFNDFRLFAAAVSEMTGGVYVNLGSAVLLPEVFLKAFTVAQNLGARLRDFVTVNMDMMSHYRASENVVARPPQVGGKGYTLIGRHEIMVPLLAQAVVDALGGQPAPKAADWDTLLQLRRQWRAARKTVVWTNGCFDLLHVGHLRSLQAARRLGDVLVVGLNSDTSVRRLKGPTRPIVGQAERVEMLAALECVHHVVVFEESTPDAALARLQPDIHCKGSDYAPPHGKGVPEAALVQSYGGRVEYLPMVPDTSTTLLLRRIEERLSDPAPESARGAARPG